MDTELCSRSSARCSLTVPELKTLCGRDDRLPEGMLKYKWFISSLCKKDQKRFLIHTQRNATSYAYMHQHIPDQTQDMTCAHSDSNTSHFMGPSCNGLQVWRDCRGAQSVFMHGDNKFIVFEKWSRRSQCCEVELRRCNMHEFSWRKKLPHMSQLPIWGQRWISKKTNYLKYLTPIHVPVMGSRRLYFNDMSQISSAFHIIILKLQEA